MEYGLDLEYSFNEFLKGFGLSSEIAHIIWLPLPMLLVLVAAVVGVLVTVWLERKISAAAQQRIGPEYAGALGVLQPIADGLKLLVKEDIIPAKADGILFTAGPILVLVPVILSWLIVPFGQNLLISNVGIGIFLWIALSSIQPIGLLMSGYASNNKYSLLTTESLDSKDSRLDKSLLEKDDLYLSNIFEIFLFLSSIALVHKWRSKPIISKTKVIYKSKFFINLKIIPCFIIIALLRVHRS